MAIINKSKSFSVTSKSFMKDAVSFIIDSLEQAGLKKSEVMRAHLLAEENIVSMVRHAPEKGRPDYPG